MEDRQPVHAAGLEGVGRELAAATARLEALVEGLPAGGWGRRPAGGGWSAGECIVHLNATTRAFLPVLADAVERAREHPPAGPRRLRRDPLGWLLCRMLEPPARLKTRTAAPFVPAAAGEPAAEVAEWRRLQDELAALAESAAGLALDRVKVVSPFDPRARYSAYSALRILTAHQRRHLWQAERAAAG